MMEPTADRIRVEIESGGNVIVYELKAEPDSTLRFKLHAGADEPNVDITPFGAGSERSLPMQAMSLKVEATGWRAVLIREQPPS